MGPGLVAAVAKMEKICVVSRVLVGQKEIFNWGKLYDPSVNAQFVLDDAIMKAAAPRNRRRSHLHRDVRLDCAASGGGAGGRSTMAES